MGADVSSEGGYTARQAADFERKYREMYGEDLSREDLLERYRMEKLKADQKQRLEQARVETVGSRHRSFEERHSQRDKPQSRDRRSSRDRDGSSYGSRRRQQDNFDIVRRSYQHGRAHERRDTYEDRHEHRSGWHSDRDTRKDRSSRRQYSSRDRDRRRSSSRSSSKESRSDRQTSRKMRSADRKSESDHRDRNSRRSGSTDRRGSEGKSSRNRREKDRNRSPLSEHRSNKKTKDQIGPKDEWKDIKRGSKNKSSERAKEKSENTSLKRNKKKMKSGKSAHYQSAPDLNESDKQYGRGPWQRTHQYFNEYNQRPQTWVQELAQERSATMPAPVMERQIIYGLPGTGSSNIVDGLGYPLKERNPGFNPVPYNTYLMHKPSRPLSLDMSMQQPQVLPSVSLPMQSPNTRVKLPPGAVPAVGPAGAAFISLPGASQAIIPERGYEVQAHLPVSNSSTLASKDRDRGLSLPPNYPIPPQYASSTMTRSDAPTPKPRTKSPTKEQKKFVEKSGNGPPSPRRSGDGKHEKITAISAREDFESMLQPEYDYLSGDEILSPYPGNYKPNQEIFVDDVIFRKQPEVVDYAVSLTDSDATTDDEHCLTLGEELSPNTISYSSGYDLEIPAGFCFDSEGREIASSTRHKQKESTKSKNGKAVTEAKVKKTTAAHVQSQPTVDKRKENVSKMKPLVLTSIEPVSRSEPRKRRSPDPKKSPRRRNFESQAQNTVKSTRDRSASPRKDTVVFPTNTEKPKSEIERIGKHKNRRNKRIQHPPTNDQYIRIITPSQKWASKPEVKRTHDVGVGTKPARHQKSTAVQTLRLKEQTAQPIYFLKPISAQEVFIEDSLASQSETDASQAQASTATSSGSNRARSSVSWSRSSVRSSEMEESEVESVVQNLVKNEPLHSSNKEPEASSLQSIESEYPASVGPPSMTLGVSESIQASSYTGKGGKVFCLTRSRHGSPPLSVSRAPSQETRSADGHALLQPRQDSRTDPEHDQLDAHEVGKWVLDCYTQDRKLTSRSESYNESGLMTSPGAAVESNYVPIHSSKFAPLTKQQRVEYEASFDVDSEDLQSPRSPGMPTVLPLTTETLLKRNGSTGFSQSSSQGEYSGTELSADAGIFQKELKRTKRKMQRQRQNSLEEKWKADQYKAQLKQWNDSPTSNVVLAEVCCVTDEDLDDPPQSAKSTREIQPSTQTPSSLNRNEKEESDSESATSESSGEIISPKENLKRALNVGRYGPSQNEKLRDLRPQMPPTTLEKNSARQNGVALNKTNPPWNQGGQRGVKIPAQPPSDEDWRIVGAPKSFPTSYRPAKDASDNFFQQDPYVPRAQMQRRSAEANGNPSSVSKADWNASSSRKNSEEAVTQQAFGSDAVPSPNPMANPFNKMNEEEIHSLVGNIPGRGSLEKSSSEKELLEKLERTRLASKRESLEERTARILGIHRKASSDEEEINDSSAAQKPGKQNPQPPSAPSSFPDPLQKDLNAYVNNLLTGVTDVSPVTRKKYFVGDLDKKHHVTSPLATSSASTKNSHPPTVATKQIDRRQENGHSEEIASEDDSSQTGDEDTTITETFSVNVSESVMTASMTYRVKPDGGNHPSPPTEYKIPKDVENQQRGPAMSPTGGMMLSYGNNIYADTPGFHGKQQSFDSTESDEPELDPAWEKEHVRTTERRVQKSHVPISPTSPPLTEQELNIVRELVKSSDHSRTASQNSVAALNEERMNPPSHPPSDPNRFSPVSAASSLSGRPWSPNREQARQKVAKSVGLTLRTDRDEGLPKKQHQTSHHSLPFDSAEFDIKVLSANGKTKQSRNSVSFEEASPLEQDRGSVENVMESIGLDPDETWLLSV